MIYRAHIRFDFAHKDNNEYQKLVVALMQLGWKYVETSALAIETQDISDVLMGLEVCAKQIRFVGDMSGLLIDMQGCESFDGKGYAAAANHPNALEDVRNRPLPR